MRVADVEYDGPMRQNRQRTPNGNVYILDIQTTTEVNSVADAEWFERGNSVTVNWTPQGRIILKLRDEVDGTGELLESLAYRSKQKLASAFGIKGNQSEDDLDEQLQPVVEDLQQEMESL